MSAGLIASPLPAMAKKAPTLWQPATPSPKAFIARALLLARQGSARGDGTRFGCVIVKDNVIVGEGWNKANVKHDQTAHAEVEAIQDASKRLETRHLSGCVLYTNGRRPCPMCETTSYWAGIEKIVTAVSTDKIVERGAPHYGGC